MKNDEEVKNKTKIRPVTLTLKEKNQKQRVDPK